MDVKKIQFPSKQNLNFIVKSSVAVGYLSIRIFGLNDHKGKNMHILWYGISIDKYCRDFKKIWKLEDVIYLIQN